MGRLIQGLLDTLKLTDEDDDFDDEDYDLAPETKKKRETVRPIFEETFGRLIEKPKC